MNCQQIDNFIYAYCDNTLSPEQRLLFDRHLKSCKNCRNKLSLTLLENEILKESDDIPVLSDDFTCKIMKTIRLNKNLTQKNLEKSLFDKIINIFNDRFPYSVFVSTAAAVILLFIVFMPFISNIPTGFIVADNAGVKSNVSADLPKENNKQLVKNENTNQEETIENQAGSVKETMNFGADLDDNNTGSNGNDSKISTDEAYKTPEFKDMELKQNISKSNSTEILQLHPANLPPIYNLSTIISETDGSLSFIYNNNETNDQLKIVIVAAQESDIPVGVENNLKREISASDYATVKNTREITITQNMEYCSHIYTVTISSANSAHSAEDLMNILSSLEIKEGI